MKPVAIIHELPNYKILVLDITLDTKEYLEEDAPEYHNISNFKFRYSESYTINIIQLVKLQSKEYLDTHIYNHSTKLDEYYFELPLDGYYLIHHMILPSMEWAKEHEFLVDQDVVIYTTDGDLIYKTQRGELLIVDGQEVLVDKVIYVPVEGSEELCYINTVGTTILRITLQTFAVNRLRECFILLCKSIFDGLLAKCASKDKNFKDGIFKRDLVWMTLNVIKFLICKQSYLEALRILEQISYCGGVCNPLPDKSKSTNGCGCSKREVYSRF